MAFRMVWILVVFILSLPGAAAAGTVGKVSPYRPFNLPPPTILMKSTALLPPDGATNIGVQSPIGVSFNQGIDLDAIVTVSPTLDCRLSARTPWYSIPMGGPMLAEPKALVFAPKKILPFNAECKATLTGLPDVAGSDWDTQKTGDGSVTWFFKTRPKDQCQLDACQSYYQTLLAWEKGPGRQCIEEDGECVYVICLLIPKSDYQNVFAPLLNECVKSHPGETPAVEAGVIEGTDACKNPNAVSALLTLTDEKEAYAHLAGAMPDRFEPSDVAGKVVVCDWNPNLAAARAQGCQNSCNLGEDMGPVLQKP